MGGPLRIATSANVSFGPFVDKSNAVSAETGLTPSVAVTKNGAAYVARASGNAVAHDQQGWYRVPLGSVDVNTAGRLRIMAASPNTHLAVWDDFVVMSSAAYSNAVTGGLVGVGATQADVESARANLATDIANKPTIASVSTAVQNNILNYHLDHVAHTSAPAGVPVSNTITQRIMGGGFDPTTDALQDIRDRGDAAWIAATGFGTPANIESAKAETLSGVESARATLADPANVESARADLYSAGASNAADLVWDRLLLGSTHNITNSAGRRLRQLQERGVYQDGAIWIDTVNGTAGTEDFENGTSFNPVDNLADALTLATSVGLARFRIAPGSSLTFVSTLTNKQFVGSSWTLALGGQEITGTLIIGAEVSGTALMATGHADFANCDMGTCTLGAFELLACGLESTLTLSAAANYHFDQCFHHAAAGTSVIIDFGAAVLNTVVHMHHHSGPVEIQNLGQAGTDTVIYEGFGALTLNANCVGGTVNIRGNITLVNNGSGMTINDDARIDTGQINAEVDTAIADAAFVTIGSIGTQVWHYSLSAGMVVGQAGHSLRSAAAAAGGAGATIGSIEEAVWHYSLSAGMIVGQAGFVLRSAAANAGVTTSGAVTSADRSNIASEVWDRLRSSHVASGSFGQGEGIQVGSGGTAVDHDTGGVDNLRLVDDNNAAISDADIRVYLKSNWDSGLRTVGELAGQTTTKDDGRWNHEIYLDSGVTYTIVYTKTGSIETTTKELTV